MAKIRRRSRQLYDALLAKGMKKKRAEKVANSFDAYLVDDRTAQRRAAGRKGGQATARKRKATKKSSAARKRTGTRKKATARKSPGSKRKATARKPSASKKKATARRRTGTKGSARKTR